MRCLCDRSASEVQHKHVALAPITVGDEGDPAAVRREHWLAVVVGTEGQLLGLASLDRHPEQVAQHGEDQPLAVGREGDIG